MAVSTTEHMERVAGLGADRVIDRTAVDFSRDQERFDIVLDAVGKSTFATCKPLLRLRGLYMSTDLGPVDVGMCRMVLVRSSTE